MIKNNDKVTLKRSLTLWQLVLFGLAFMMLTTVFTTYGLAAEMTQGMVTGAYIIAMCIMLFTAYSYGQMAKEYPIAGSAYSYAQRAIHPNVGFMVGWAVLMDYIFIPMVNYLVFGIFFHAAFPEIPEYIFILAIILIVTTINLRGITIAAKANFVIIIFSALFLIIYSVFVIKSILGGVGTGTLVNLKAIYNSENSLSYMLTGASLLCFSFLGFDSISTFSEEAINPKKNIPKAIFIATFLGGLIFSSIAYLSHNLWPNYLTFSDPDAASYELVSLAGGKLLEALFLAVTAIAITGSALSAQASGARVLYAMGRERLLPSFFGQLHPKHQTPINNILLISFLSLFATIMTLHFIASFINFGAFVAFIAVNISVIFLFFKKYKEANLHNILLFLVIPFIGASLDFLLLINLNQYSLLVGFIWFLLGLIYLLFLTKGFKHSLSADL